MVEGWVNGGWKGGLLLISQVPHKSCTAENKLSSVDNDPATNQNDTATNMNDTATNKNDTATHMIDTPSRKNGPTIRPILFLTKRSPLKPNIFLSSVAENRQSYCRDIQFISITFAFLAVT